MFAYVLFGTYTRYRCAGLRFQFQPGVGDALDAAGLGRAGARSFCISTLGGGAQVVEAAIAVGLSGVRLLPMVVSLMPILRGPKTKAHQLFLPAHFTAVSMWVETMRLAPQMPVEAPHSFRQRHCHRLHDLGADRDRCRLLSCGAVAGPIHGGACCS